MDLNTIWFLLTGVFLTGYAILDGFDLGIGILHLFIRKEQDRLINMRAISPIWDGNEVWLIAGTGSLFAVFPLAYATILSAFYFLFIMLLFSLIFRAISIEFRNKESSQKWQHFWDRGFGLGSLTASFIFGVMLGNIINGLPINKEGIFASDIILLLNPYSIMIGLLILTIFTMHGGIYMTLKTDGVLQEKMRRSVFISWIAFIILYSSAIISTLIISPIMFDGLLNRPLSFVLAFIQFATTIFIVMAIKRNRFISAFVSSSLLIAATICLLGLSLFPLLVPSRIDLLYSLTIYNAASRPYTLFVMLIIASISFPLVIAYSVYVHRIFKGKVDTSEEEGY